MARSLIADQNNEVAVSTVSFWEIAVKVRIGKLRADVAEVIEASDRQGFIQLGIEAEHLIALDALPRHPDHRDPFDHLLIVQAITSGATFMSEDRNTSRYPVPFLTCSG